MTPLTDAEIEAIEKRCAAATPGPWEHQKDGYGSVEILAPLDGKEVDPVNDRRRVFHEYTHKVPVYEDLDFIAHSRTGLPRLLDDLKAARVALEQIRNEADYAVKEDSRTKQFLGNGHLNANWVLDKIDSTYDGKP